MISTIGGPTVHISKRDAEAEAVRLAEAFLMAEWPDGARSKYEFRGARADDTEPGYRDCKTVIKYTVVFGRIGWDGGEAMIRVNIRTQEAGWWP